MTKYLKSFLLLVLMALSSHVFAYDFESGGLYYTIVDAANLKVEVSLRENKPKSGATYYRLSDGWGMTGVGSSINPDKCWDGYQNPYVTIPETVNYNGITWTVSGIGKYAFAVYCYRLDSKGYYVITVTQNRDLYHITLPRTLEYIDDYAFEGCVNLQSIEFPEGLKKLGTYAFAYCTSLSNVTLPEEFSHDCYSVGYYCFANCTNLLYAVLPSTQNAVPGMFQNCSKLTSVFIKANFGSWSGGTKAFPDHTIVFVPTKGDIEALQGTENHYYANAVPMVLYNNSPFKVLSEPLAYGPLDVEALEAELELPINNVAKYYPESEITTRLTYVNERPLPDPDGFLCQLLVYFSTLKGPYGIVLDDIVCSELWAHINKRELAISVDDVDVLYGDAIPELKYSLDASQFVFDDSEKTINPIQLTLSSTPKDVGSYAIMASLQDPCYTIALKGNPKLNVKKAPLVVKAADVSKTYGDENPLSYDLSYAGLKYNETKPEMLEPFKVSTTAKKTSGVGNYDIVVSGGLAKNYDIQQYQNGTFSIYKANLTVKPIDIIKTYGDENPLLKVSCKGLKNNDNEATAFSVAPSLTTQSTRYSNAGVYKITASGAESPNYELTYETGSLTIEKAQLEAKAKNYTRIYGEENPSFEIIYDGFRGSDDESCILVPPVIKCKATRSSDVGVYPISLTNGECDNYSFVYQDGKLTIEQAEQTLTWDQTLGKVDVGEQIPISASASSGLELTVTSDNEDVAQVYKVGRTWYIDCVGAGIASIKVQQMGNINYFQSPRMIKTIEVMSSEQEVDHDYVDLGLPSGILWATCNVGAKRSYEYGDYLSREDASKRISEDWGESWSIPFLADFNELFNNCTVVWTTENNVQGAKFSREGKSIFLPAGGLMFGSRYLSSPGSCGEYNTFAYYKVQFSDAGMIISTNDELFKLNTRPVRRKTDNTSIAAPSDAATAKSYIYNIAGQRMSTVRKGLNIVNGKKVVVK